MSESADASARAAAVRIPFGLKALLVAVVGTAIVGCGLWLLLGVLDHPDGTIATADFNSLQFGSSREDNQARFGGPAETPFDLPPGDV